MLRHSKTQSLSRTFSLRDLTRKSSMASDKLRGKQQNPSTITLQAYCRGDENNSSNIATSISEAEASHKCADSLVDAAMLTKSRSYGTIDWHSLSAQGSSRQESSNRSKNACSIRSKRRSKISSHKNNPSIAPKLPEHAFEGDDAWNLSKSPEVSMLTINDGEDTGSFPPPILRYGHTRSLTVGNSRSQKRTSLQGRDISTSDTQRTDQPSGVLVLTTAKTKPRKLRRVRKGGKISEKQVVNRDDGISPNSMAVEHSSSTSENSQTHPRAALGTDNAPFMSGALGPGNAQNKIVRVHPSVQDILTKRAHSVKSSWKKIKGRIRTFPNAEVTSDGTVVRRNPKSLDVMENGTEEAKETTGSQAVKNIGEGRASFLKRTKSLKDLLRTGTLNPASNRAKSYVADAGQGGTDEIMSSVTSGRRSIATSTPARNRLHKQPRTELRGIALQEIHKSNQAIPESFSLIPDLDALLSSSPLAQSTPRIRLEPSFDDGGARHGLRSVLTSTRSVFDSGTANPYAVNEEIADRHVLSTFLARGALFGSVAERTSGSGGPRCNLPFLNADRSGFSSKSSDEGNSDEKIDNSAKTTRSEKSTHISRKRPSPNRSELETLTAILEGERPQEDLPSIWLQAPERSRHRRGGEIASGSEQPRRLSLVDQTILVELSDNQNANLNVTLASNPPSSPHDQAIAESSRATSSVSLPRTFSQASTIGEQQTNSALEPDELQWSAIEFDLRSRRP